MKYNYKVQVVYRTGWQRKFFDGRQIVPAEGWEGRGWICVTILSSPVISVGTNTRLALYKLGGGRGGDTNTNEETEIILNWS